MGAGVRRLSELSGGEQQRVAIARARGWHQFQFQWVKKRLPPRTNLPRWTNIRKASYLLSSHECKHARRGSAYESQALPNGVCG
jgi:hypothetical protein